MSKELTMAAQQALACMRGLQQHLGPDICAIEADALERALTQRPAAQTEREAFERAALAKWGQLDFERSEVEPEMYYNQRLDDAWIGFGFAVAWLRASLPAPQQATPEAEFKRINCKVNGIDGTAEVRRVDENTVDIGRMVAFADERATPEPVGEPLQGGLENDALLNAWRSKLPGVTPTDAQMTAFALGVEVGFAHARTLERSDWSRVHEALQAAGVHPGRTDDHLADVIAKALANRPAPGVPEFDVVGYVLPEALEELRMSGESAAIHDWRMRDDLVPVYVLRKPGAPGPISELLTALGPILAAVGTNDGDSMGSLNSDDKVLWTVSSSWSADVRVTLGDLRKIALAAAQAKGADK